MRRSASVALLACVVAVAASAETVTGVATVIDADTIEIHGQRIRLNGIDAVESGQQCYREATPWPCGREAALALSDLIADNTVHCNQTGKDRYERVLATCSVDGMDLSAWVARKGCIGNIRLNMSRLRTLQKP